MMYILNSVAKWANSNCFENFMWQTQHSKHQGWCPKAGRPVEWWALIGISDLDKLLEIAAHMWTLRRDSYPVTAGGPVKIMVQCSHFLQHHEQQFWKVCLLGAGLKFQLDAHHSAGCQLLGIYFGAMNVVFAPWIFQDNLNWLTPDCARACGIFDQKKIYIFLPQKIAKIRNVILLAKDVFQISIFFFSLFQTEKCVIWQKKHMWWPEQLTPTEIQILLCGFDRKKIPGSKKKYEKYFFFFDRYFGAHRRPDDWIRNWILQILM